MASTQTYPKILHADQEHAGLRTAVFILFFLALILLFFSLRTLLNSATGWVSEYAFALSCFGAFPVAVGIIWVAEKVLKQRWPSGRTVTLLTDGVRTQTETGHGITLTRAQNVLLMAWYFGMRGWQRGGRERRLPRTWLCLAVELKAEKKQISVYTYMPPRQAHSWIELEDGRIHFHKISPKNVYHSSIRSRMSSPSRPEIPAAVLTGDDSQYWLAERRRSTEGFELSPKEFEQFMNHIQTTLKL